MADTATKEKAEQFKTEGNQALKEEKLEDAIRLYTEALNLDNNEVYYSNRSAAYCKQKDYVRALEDAEKCIEKKHTWIKGWTRKGTALSYLNRYEEAKIAFEEGLKIEPTNVTCKDGIDKAETMLIGPIGSQPVNNPFDQPGAMDKLRAHPETRKYLDDPGFMNILKLSPSNMHDERLMKCWAVLLDIDFFNMESPPDEYKSSKSADGNSDTAKGATPPTPPSSPSEPNDSTFNKQNKDTNSQTQGSKSDTVKAKEAKERGNAAYKSKKFEEALKCYDEAISLDQTDMTYLNNKAAVYFEKQEFDACIETCEKAVDVGRENRANFQVIAKALARAGKAYLKKGDEENAIKYLNKSLSEHRAPDIAKLINEIEKQRKERERLSYVNPEVALEEKNKGNALFQKGKFPDALKHYTEAIKRNPEDAKLYSNRAACFTKLLEFKLALKDCDECLRIDPSFVKGHLRKGAIYTAMKESTKASHAYQKAMELDPNCKEAQEGYRNAMVSESSDPDAVRKRAMENPEIQEILSDPAMRLILEQMQKDPNALKEHLKNPHVASKIEKLLEAGIIAIR